MLPYKFWPFWPNSFWEDVKDFFSFYSYVKIWPPLWPHLTLGSIIWTYTTWVCFHTSNEVLAFLAKFFKEIDLKKFFFIHSYVKIWPPILATPYSQGSWYEQIWIYTTRRCFHLSFSFFDWMILEVFEKCQQVLNKFILSVLERGIGPSL